MTCRSGVHTAKFHSMGIFSTTVTSVTVVSKKGAGGERNYQKRLKKWVIVVKKTCWIHTLTHTHVVSLNVWNINRNKILAGWCSTPTLLLICSSIRWENGHPVLICSSLSTAQLVTLVVSTQLKHMSQLGYKSNWIICPGGNLPQNSLKATPRLVSLSWICLLSWESKVPKATAPKK